MTKLSKAKSPEETGAVEKLIVDTQFRIHNLMAAKNVSRSDLAARLGCSKARVTQLFGDHPNLTLETLARIFHALGEEPRVTSDAVEAVVAKLKSDVAQLPWNEGARDCWVFSTSAANAALVGAHTMTAELLKVWSAQAKVLYEAGTALRGQMVTRYHTEDDLLEQAEWAGDHEGMISAGILEAAVYEKEYA